MFELKENPGSFWQSGFLHLVLIVLVGLIAYSNTFNVPFQWDEEVLLNDNPIIKNLDYFNSPSTAKGLSQYDAFARRYIGYLTFAVNYKLHGFEVDGYHLFNILIHIINAILVYFFVINIYNAPIVAKSRIALSSSRIALFTGLIFVAHPIQTEAVTYIFQRFASLATFFYLGAILSYTAYKQSSNRGRRIVLYSLSLLSSILAMKTKENSFTIPFVIIAYDSMFYENTLKSRIYGFIPFLLTLPIIPLSLTGHGGDISDSLQNLVSSTIGNGETSRSSYLITQIRVIVTYIRLIFFPFHQNIDYDYPIYNSLLNSEVIASAGLLVSILIAAYILRRKNPSEHSVVSFGILWFFITLSVESSIIPIPMVINEYRVYLPSVGALLAITSMVVIFINRFFRRREPQITYTLFLAIAILFSTLAHSRNEVWGSQISLWEDTARKSPNKVRVLQNLADAYILDRQTARAVELYFTILEYTPYDSNIHYILGDVFTKNSDADSAIKHYNQAAICKPDFHDAFNNLGNAYFSKGAVDNAIENYNKAVILKYDFVEAHNNLGNAYRIKGLYDKSREQYYIALRIRPNYAEARFNLGLLYLNMGKKGMAKSEFKTALDIKPDYEEAGRYLEVIEKSEK